MVLSTGNAVKRTSRASASLVSREALCAPSAPSALAKESPLSGISGVYELRLPTEVRITDSEACDEFAGIDRLDREELDDDGPGPVNEPDSARDSPVTPHYRRSA